MAPAPEVPGASAVAVHMKERIVVWNRPKGAEPAMAAYLLIEAPFAEVQPAVHKALAGFGRFESSSELTMLAYQRGIWDQVLLSRRPDLRDALAERLVRPQLDLAYREGALTAAEVERRMARALAEITSTPQNRALLEAFHQTYPSYSAIQSRSIGMLRGSRSELKVYVFDVSAAFGHPTTAVEIEREDTFPNPNHATWGAISDFNPLRTPPSRTLTSATVPAPLFEAVHAALVALNSGKSVRVALTPKVWTKTFEPPTHMRDIVLTPPQTDQSPIQAETLRWESIDSAQADAFAYPHDLLVLPDGDLLLSADALSVARVPSQQSLRRISRCTGESSGQSGL